MKNAKSKMVVKAEVEVVAELRDGIQQLSLKYADLKKKKEVVINGRKLILVPLKVQTQNIVRVGDVVELPEEVQMAYFGSNIHFAKVIELGYTEFTLKWSAKWNMWVVTHILLPKEDKLVECIK